MSIDVGLVVVGADLLGLVDRHTPGLGKMMSKDTNTFLHLVGKPQNTTYSP